MQYVWDRAWVSMPTTWSNCSATMTIELLLVDGGGVGLGPVESLRDRICNGSRPADARRGGQASIRTSGREGWPRPGADTSFPRHPRQEVRYTRSHTRWPKRSLSASHGPAARHYRSTRSSVNWPTTGSPVTVTCRVLGLARQPYYRWLKEPVTDAELDEAHLANAVFDAHSDDPEFGYRFLADEVRAAGRDVCDRTVWRICRDNRWWSCFGKPRSRTKRSPGTPAHDDLVRRRFSAGGPNRLLLADITEHPTA